jgi:NAD(P)H dehydrogenase (quinone)
MKVLVLYFSKGGNTAKLAKDIAKGVEAGGGEALIKTTADVTKDDFLNAAGVIAGSPVYFGVMAAELKKIFDEFVSTRRKMENKVGAAFATGGHPTGGKETTMIVGDPMDASGHYGVGCVGAPDNTAADDGFKLGKRVARLCARLQD